MPGSKMIDKKRIPSRLNVLIACEESQRVCSAFRSLGHRAFSADLQKCAGKHPEWHICGDVRSLFVNSPSFKTMDGKRHHLSRWDLIISHPPCTYLCRASLPNMVINGVLQKDRFQKMLLGRKFFFECLNAPARYVAVENPLPMARAKLPKPTTFIQPYWFGSRWSKKTLLWLKNLPPLMPTCINPNHKQLVYYSSGKYRSRTDPGVANAMATQWSEYILDDLRRGEF